jgi:hypothetical protein
MNSSVRLKIFVERQDEQKRCIEWKRVAEEIELLDRIRLEFNPPAISWKNAWEQGIIHRLVKKANSIDILDLKGRGGDLL